jgi:hypothetical protein
MMHKVELAKAIGVIAFCSHLFAGGAESSDVLTNGNFDSNPVGIGWTQSGAFDPPIIGPSGVVSAQSAPNVAQLGGVIASNHELYQTVTIPPGATSLTLTGYYQIRTDESGTTTVYDDMRIQLRTTANVVLQTLVTWSNLNPTSVWTPITLPAATSHAGETIRLYISASNDSEAPTTFFLDTLTLEASVPTSVPPPSPLTSWGRIKGVYR